MEREQAFSLVRDLEAKGLDQITLYSQQFDWTVVLRIHGLNSDVLKDALNTVEFPKLRFPLPSLRRPGHWTSTRRPAGPVFGNVTRWAALEASV
jgi:hypothetical protein